MSPLEFYSRLVAYCAAMGASVTSYGRTANHNQRVGGVTQSGHRFWLAADVVYDELPHKGIANDAAKRLGLRAIREGEYDHLQPLDWPPG